MVRNDLRSDRLEKLRGKIGADMLISKAWRIIVTVPDISVIIMTLRGALFLNNERSLGRKQNAQRENEQRGKS